MMKALSFALALLWAASAWAVNLPTTPADYSASGALTGTGTVAVQTNGTATTLVSATGSGTGLTFSFQCFDGVNWISWNAYPISSGALGTPVTTASANGDWLINSAGCAPSSNTGVRVNLTAISGGTETFKLNASAGVGPTPVTLIPGGALAANQSVNVAQVNGVTTLTNTGAVGTGAQRVAVGTDTATIAGSAPGTAGTASANVVTVQGVTSMTPVQVSQATAANLNATAVQGTGVGTNTAAWLVEQGCAGQTTANTSVTPINLASTTSLKLVSKVSAKNVYICAINLVSASANNVALIAGTKVTTDCDTSTAGLAGGTTAATGWNFAANGGLTAGNGQGILFKTASTNIDVCLLASGSGQVSGTITWAQF